MDDETLPETGGFFTVAATSHHEMYLSWIEAGFTTDQAFELIKEVISTMSWGIDH